MELGSTLVIAPVGYVQVSEIHDIARRAAQNSKSMERIGNGEKHQAPLSFFAWNEPDAIDRERRSLQPVAVAIDAKSFGKRLAAHFVESFLVEYEPSLWVSADGEKIRRVDNRVLQLPEGVDGDLSVPFRNLLHASAALSILSATRAERFELIDPEHWTIRMNDPVSGTTTDLSLLIAEEDLPREETLLEFEAVVPPPSELIESPQKAARRKKGGPKSDKVLACASVLRELFPNGRPNIPEPQLIDLLLAFMRDVDGVSFANIGRSTLFEAKNLAYGKPKKPEHMETMETP